MISDKGCNEKKCTEAGSTGPPTLSVDWELYGQYLEDTDLSETEVRQLLEALWSIVTSFVDLGFGVHPVQQALQEPLNQVIRPSCGSKEKTCTLMARETPYMLGLGSAQRQTETGISHATARKHRGTSAKIYSDKETQNDKITGQIHDR